MLILHQKAKALLGKASSKETTLQEQYPDERKIMEELFTELCQHTVGVFQHGARILA
jgi:hypothetical protein